MFNKHKFAAVVMCKVCHKSYSGKSNDSLVRAKGAAQNKASHCAERDRKKKE